MKIVLIRHGMTRGNLEGRYIGCGTDEGLCGQGIAMLRQVRLPPVSRVYASPMLRCLQSAAILYPGIPPQTVDDFRECSFGIFEGKSYRELNGRPDYQAWIDSGGTAPFPGGESRAQFAKRSLDAFRSLDLYGRKEDCALVVHGGTIMAVMEAMARPAGSYFDFQVKCGHGFILYDDGRYDTV